MKGIYKHLKECGYTRQDILEMDKETITKLKDQSFIQRIINK